jgi:hypothetical protein
VVLGTWCSPPGSEGQHDRPQAHNLEAAAQLASFNFNFSDLDSEEPKSRFCDF